jgi:hypothetical protein
MKITKNNNVIIEITNTRNGCLEQGGYSGRVLSYPLSGVIAATGLSRGEIENAEAFDTIADRGCNTIAALCEYEMAGRVVRTGHIIE